MNHGLHFHRLSAILLALAATGCGAPRTTSKQPEELAPGVEARYTARPIIVDGQLDDEAWRSARVYELQLGGDRGSGQMQREGGSARLAWDDEYLYVGVEFADDDIVAEGQSDQLHHYKMGDVCEVFLKPHGETWYWELYATPLGRKSSFWFPGRGRFGLSSNFIHRSGLRVAAQTNGSVNNWRDTDRKWTAEMAIPIRDLTARGESFGPQSDWRILIARYNYSRYHSQRGAELTMTPQLSQTNFHLLEEYAPLRLTRGAAPQPIGYPSNGPKRY